MLVFSKFPEIFERFDFLMKTRIIDVLFSVKGKNIFIIIIVQRHYENPHILRHFMRKTTQILYSVT
jgi:hypothetical protein